MGISPQPLNNPQNTNYKTIHVASKMSCVEKKHIPSKITHLHIHLHICVYIHILICIYVQIYIYAYTYIKSLEMLYLKFKGDKHHTVASVRSLELVRSWGERAVVLHDTDSITLPLKRNVKVFPLIF